MSTLTRRQAIEFIGVATSFPLGMRPRSLLAQTPTRLFIGTAGKGGVFYPLGTAMAAVISKYASEVEAIAPETNGTVENIKLLQEGKIELALAQPDIAWAATQGRLDDLRKMVPVRNLLGTHATYLHLVTLAGGRIEAVEDLRGKRVSTGPAASATETKALRVFQAHGVTPYNLGTHEHLEFAEAAEALRDGRLDAFALDAALPMPALLELAAAPGVRLRLIPTGDAVSRITAKHGPFYFVAPIPKGTYPGVDADVAAAAGTTLFVAHETMEESLAYEITKVLLERIREVASACEAAKETSSASAVRGSSIPFHAGALRYYKENGVAVPQS
jgi:uncharacterized protein